MIGRVLLVVSCSFVLGCGPAVGGGNDDETSGTSSGGGETTGAVTSTTGSLSTSTTIGSPATTTGAQAESSSGGGFLLEPDMGVLPGLPNGEQCDDGDACESGECYLFPGAPIGLCSDCSEDADCMSDGEPGTCSFGATGWAVCTDGEAGVFCEATENCQPGLFCAETFGGFSQCSECQSQDDCPEADTACTPTFDLGLSCVAFGTVDDGEPCDLGFPEVCVSGICTDAEFMGESIGIAVCGECAGDEDCPDGETCTPAETTMSSIDPAVCE